MAATGGSLSESKSPLSYSALQVRGTGPEAGACPPGQGLRYLEHLCLVLEQMARLQQLHLQLQTQRPPGVSEQPGGQAVGRAHEWGRHTRGGTPGTRASFRTASASAQALTALLSCSQGPVEEEELTVAPSPPPSHASGSEMRGSWELHSQAPETGMGQLCLPPRAPGRPPEPWAGWVCSWSWLWAT